MIQLEGGELNLINILASNSQRTKNEFDKCMSAQESLIKLIEKKYNAVFDQKTGEFNPKQKTKD